MTPERIHYGKDASHFGDLYRPGSVSGKLPLVILIHGGYWKDNHDLNSYATINLVEPLLNQGAAVWNLEYRRMEFEGKNTSAIWPAALQDVASGIDFLRSIAAEKALDLGCCLVIGHSAGGHLATWAASRANLPENAELYRENPLLPQRMISIAGIIDFGDAGSLSQTQQVERLLGGSEAQFPQRYAEADPARLSKGLHLPQLIIQGGKDIDVPPSQGRGYRDSSDNPQLTYIEWPDADHFSMLIEPGKGEWTELVELLKKEIESL